MYNCSQSLVDTAFSANVQCLFSWWMFIDSWYRENETAVCGHDCFKVCLQNAERHAEAGDAQEVSYLSYYQLGAKPTHLHLCNQCLHVL